MINGRSTWHCLPQAISVGIPTSHCLPTHKLLFATDAESIYICSVFWRLQIWEREHCFQTFLLSVAEISHHMKSIDGIRAGWTNYFLASLSTDIFGSSKQQEIRWLLWQNTTVPLEREMGMEVVICQQFLPLTSTWGIVHKAKQPTRVSCIFPASMRLRKRKCECPGIK